MIGNIPKNKEMRSVSAYQPSGDVIDLTKVVKKDYSFGVELLNKPWRELNDYSVIEDQNRGELMFNAFVDTSYEDPNDAWEWRGTRSKARNKALGMHAQLTANFLLPFFKAQSDDDEEDRDFSEAMQDVIKWMSQPNVSNYQSSYLQIVMSMITDPIVYLGADFFEVMQEIKERTKDGTLKKKEVLDEVLSGFKASIWGCTEVLLSNAYERNIQKQKCIIQRRFVEREELEAKYGNHPNWGYVQDGIKSIYSDDDELFYDVHDDEHPNLVAEEIYKSRRKDLEVPFVNGIYMGDPNVNDNPIRHRDNRGAPKYNIVPFGYYPIGKHFVYYKSLMNALAWDNMLIDAVYETWMNKNFLDANMPVAISGSDQVDSEVIFPKSVVTLESKDAKVIPLLPPRNEQGLILGMSKVEESMSEGSVNETLSGSLPDASQKAYNVAQAQANAKTLLRGVGKSLAWSVSQYGLLMKDIAINHIVVPQVDELLGERLVLSYKMLTIDNKETGESKTIRFDQSLIGKEATEDEKNMMELKELDELIKNGHKGKKLSELKQSVRRVNPELFARFNYLSTVDVEEIFRKGQDYWQPILMQLKQMLAQDPYIDQSELSRELMYSFFQSKADKFIKENPEQGLPQGRIAGTELGNQVQQKAISNVTQNIV